MKDLFAKLKEERNIKKIILTLATICLSVFELYKTNGTFEEAAFFVNFIGVSVFAFTVFRLKLRDFLKIPYYVYAVLGLVGVVLVYKFFAERDVFTSRFLIAEFNVYLYGFLLIRLIYYIVELIKDKKKPGFRPTFLFWGWIVMMLLCVFSVNNSIWPLWFLMIFGAYYITPATEEETKDIFESLVNGLIIAFFIIQCLAFLYRPFGYVRYKGFFYNSNMNSLFYLVSYAAFLIKLHVLRENEASKVVRVIAYAITCSLWSFMWLTAGRGAFLGFVVITFVYLIIEEFIFKKRGFKGFLLSGILMFAVFALSTFPVYACIRYIPELRHHPVFFQDEYNDLSMIKSDNIHDKDAYPTFAESYLAMIGRLNYEKQSDYARTNDKAGEETVISGVGDLNDTGVEKAHAESYYQEVSYGKLDVILGVRKFAWMYFGSHLNLFGHEESFKQVQVTPTFACNHPHNSFLFMAYGYGMIAGALFLVWVFGMPVYILVRYFKEKEHTPIYFMFTMFSYLAFICYGFFETSSYPGRVVFGLLFLTALPFMRKAEISGLKDQSQNERSED